MSRVIFSFGGVINQARNSYSQLDDENKGILNTYLLLLLLILIATIALEYFPLGQTPLGKGVQSIFLGIWIALTFAVVDRLNILSPIQEQINRRIGNLDATVAKVSEGASNLDGYNKYARARHTFGFNAVVGLVEVSRKSGAAHSRFASTNLIIGTLDDAKKGDEVRYMTTFIKDYQEFLYSLEAALRRGVTVRLMLMMPCANTPIVEARHMDFLSLGEDRHQFAARIRIFSEIICRNRDAFQRDGLPFELLFYTKALHFPMIIVTSSVADRLVEEVAYTGFYVQQSAESMPYIEWRGGDFQIAKHFKGVFESKWAACKVRALDQIDCDDAGDA